MHRTFLILLLALASIAAAAAFTPAALAAETPSNNPDWFWQNPLPRGTAVAGIALVGSNDVWTVSGGSKGFLHSADGGATWDSVAAASEFGATAITFPDQDHGYAVGSDTLDAATLAAVAYRSDDGGATWESKDLIYGSSAGLNDLSFPTVTHGWAVGGGYPDGSLILATADGGDSWSDQSPGTDEELSGVCFIDAQSGWAVGEMGAILVTADGGVTWTPQEGPTGEIDVSEIELKAVAMADTTHGWAVGTGGSIWRTTDGATWSTQTSPVTEDLTAIVCADDSRAWTVSSAGSILRTTDGGAKWSVVKRVSPRLWSLTTDDGSRLWAGGDNGYMLASTDGGATWTRSGSGTTGSCLSDVDALDTDTACAVGEDGLIVTTTDGGATWTRQNTPVETTLQSVSFGTTRIGFVVGNAGTILKTSDAGTTWRRSGRPTRARLTSVSSVDSKHVWIAGSGGRIYRSVDGGRHWQRQRSNTRADLDSITFVDRSYGWAVGGRSILLRTTDGGRHWRATRVRYPLKGAELQTFFSVCFVDRKYGWIAATSMSVPGRTILRTMDGGRTWYWSALNRGSFMQDVCFVDRRHGIAVGEMSVMYTTEDGGRTWDWQGVTDGIGGLSAVDMATQNTGWTVGSGCSILKTTGEPEQEPRAVAWASQTVRRGTTAKLPVKLIRTADGTADIVIKIRTAWTNVKTLRRSDVRVGQLCRLSFRCWLPKGRYRYYVYAVDDGTWQQSPSSKPLIVR